MSDEAITSAWEAGRAEWRVAKYAGDLYLAAACLAGDTVALDAFDRELLVSARKAVGAIDLEHAGFTKSTLEPGHAADAAELAWLLWNRIRDTAIAFRDSDGRVDR